MVLDGQPAIRSNWAELGGNLWMGDISPHPKTGKRVQDVKIIGIPPENAKLAIRMCRVKPKRIMSEALKTVLDRARSLLPSPPQRQRHGVESLDGPGVMVRGRGSLPERRKACLDALLVRSDRIKSSIGNDLAGRLLFSDPTKRETFCRRSVAVAREHCYRGIFRGRNLGVTHDLRHTLWQHAPQQKPVSVPISFAKATRLSRSGILTCCHPSTRTAQYTSPFFSFRPFPF